MIFFTQENIFQEGVYKMMPFFCSGLIVLTYIESNQIPKLNAPCPLSQFLKSSFLELIFLIAYDAVADF